MLDKLKGYKTIITGAAVAVLGFLETFDITNILGLIPDQYDPLAVSFVGFLMVVLRLVTNTPAAKK
jgi:hypothetical protein